MSVRTSGSCVAARCATRASRRTPHGSEAPLRRPHTHTRHAHTHAEAAQGGVGAQVRKEVGTFEHIIEPYSYRRKQSRRHVEQSPERRGEEERVEGAAGGAQAHPHALQNKLPGWKQHDTLV